MSITAMSDRLITIYRKTANVIDSISATSPIPITRQPTKDCLIEIEIGGTGFAAGSVTVAGDVNGAPDSEVLSFTAAGTVKTTRKRFDAGTLLSFTSTLPGTVTVIARAVGGGGERLHVNTLIISDWPARFDRGRARWPAPAQGSNQVEKTRFYIDWTDVFTVQEGDTIIDQGTSEQFFVIGAPTLHGARLTAHHWEIEVRRREQSSTS